MFVTHCDWVLFAQVLLFPTVKSGSELSSQHPTNPSPKALILLKVSWGVWRGERVMDVIYGAGSLTSASGWASWSPPEALSLLLTSDVKPYSPSPPFLLGEELRGAFLPQGAAEGSPPPQGQERQEHGTSTLDLSLDTPKVKAKVAQSCLTLFVPLDYSPPGSCPWNCSGHIQKWVAVSFSRRSSQRRDQTQVSRTVDWFFTFWAIREAPGAVQMSTGKEVQPR